MPTDYQNIGAVGVERDLVEETIGDKTFCEGSLIPSRLEKTGNDDPQDRSVIIKITCLEDR